jgi:hypothetical protein
VIAEGQAYDRRALADEAGKGGADAADAGGDS